MNKYFLLCLTFVAAFAAVGMGGCESDGWPAEEGKASSSHTGSPLKPSNKAERGASLDSLGAYELAVHLVNYKGMHTLTINGFPVDRLPVMGVTSDQIIAARLNTALVGEKNKASVRVEPYLTRSGKRLLTGTIEMKAWIQRDEGNQWLPGTKITEAEVDSSYQRWKDQARKQWEQYLKWEKQWLEKTPDSSSTITSKEGGALDSMRAWTIENPLVVATTFDNEAGPDFSKIFEEAPRLPDTPATRERVKDYAIHLRDLLRSGDAEGIYQEIQPSVSEEIGWYKVTRSGRRDSALAQIRREWVRDFQLDFSRSEVGLRRWSSGRVWELFVQRPEEGERPFFWEGPSASYLKVYVAEMGGKLRIVRLDV